MNEDLKLAAYTANQLQGQMQGACQPPFGYDGGGARTCIPTRPTTGLTFAQAIERVLEGAKVRRAHTWAEGVVVFMNDGDNLTMVIPDLDPEKTHVELDYDDLLARDWMVVE